MKTRNPSLVFCVSVINTVTVATLATQPSWLAAGFVGFGLAASYAILRYGWESPPVEMTAAVLPDDVRVVHWDELQTQDEAGNAIVLDPGPGFQIMGVPPEFQRLFLPEQLLFEAEPEES